MGETINKDLLKSMNIQNVFKKIKKFWGEIDEKSKILIILIGISLITLLIFLLSSISGKGGIISPSSPPGGEPPFP